MNRRLIAALALVCLSTAPLLAVIKKLTPLKEVIGDSHSIVVVVVEKVAADKPAVTFQFSEQLKGKKEFESYLVNLKGDSFAKKDDHTKAMLDRLVPNQKLLLFVAKVEQTYVIFGFLEGTWFQMRGTSNDEGKTVTWAFLHCEPFFRRTFKGSTEELKAVVEKAVSGKAEPPAPNEKEEPGLGPVPEKKSAIHRSPMLYGVIPTTILIGPLALIAALFPAFFARLAIAMKQWRVLLAVASITTTLTALYYFCRSSLPDRWAFSPTAMLAYVATVCLIGLIVSGYRYRRLAQQSPAITAPPSRTTLLTLLGSIAGLGAFLIVAVYFFVGRAGLTEIPTREFTGITFGLVFTLLYAVYRVLTKNIEGTTTDRRLSLSGESVALFGMSIFSLYLLALAPVPSPTATGVVVGEATEQTVGPKLADVQLFTFAGATEVYSGIAVGPDGRMYFGAESASGTGSVWCANSQDGQVIWKFTNGGNLQPVYCTPTVTTDRIFLGEGLHTDSDRRMFCLDAKSGQALWNFKTNSHTEGQAALVGDRLIFSAGDDGLLCISTETRKQLWQIAGNEKKLHVDTPPAIVGHRVYFGSGYHTLAAVCADINTGEELWRYPTDLRSFGPPLTRGQRVYYGLGTGNLIEDLSEEKEDASIPKEKEPKGAIICLTQSSGELVWRYDLPKSVHTNLAADLSTIYANSKDGTVYALDRATGKLRWKRPVGGAFATGPVIATHANGAATVAVYAVSLEGRAVCLNPKNGDLFWSRDLAEYTKKRIQILSMPALLQLDHGAKRVLLFGGKSENTSNGERIATVFRIEDVIEE